MPRNDLRTRAACASLAVNGLPTWLRRKTAVLYLRNKICGKFARHARNENVARLERELRHFKLDQLALLSPEQFCSRAFFDAQSRLRLCGTKVALSVLTRKLQIAIFLQHVTLWNHKRGED